MPLNSLFSLKNGSLKPLAISLIIVDFLFVLAHVYTIGFLNYKPNYLLLDAKEFGYPESYQYLKYLGILLLLIFLIVFKRKYSYTVFFFIFMFLFIDDVTQLHLSVSQNFVEFFQFENFLMVKALNIGQLLYASIMVIIFICLLCISLVLSSKRIKRAFYNIIFLLGALLFFGVGVDFLNMLFRDNQSFTFFLTVIEEGGEMITLSIILGYFSFLTLNSIKEDLHNMF